MKAQEVGKSKVHKAQWDLGTEVGVFGTLETSFQSSQVIILRSAFNECIKLRFILNQAPALHHPRATLLAATLNAFMASSDPFVLVPMLTLLQ